MLDMKFEKEEKCVVVVSKPRNKDEMKSRIILDSLNYKYFKL